MNCERVREAISAAMDGELAAGAQPHLSEHLADCPECQQWEDSAYAVTRRVRIQPRVPSSTGLAATLAAVQVEVRRRRVRRYWVRFGSAVVIAGVLQLLATVPLLVMARGHQSGGGRVDTLGLIELVIGAGFFVGALAVLWRDRGSASDDVIRLDAQAPSAVLHAGVSDVA